MSRVEQYLAAKLQERADAGNLRRLTTEGGAVDFFSNDYLGLVTTRKLAAMMPDAHCGEHVTGSTGSRLLSGNSEQAERLEHTIASFHGAEAALLFNSGYDANMGLIASVAGRNTTILSDALCHASIIDGIRLSMAGRKYKFNHNDTGDLEAQLKKYTTEGPVIVVVESVYSMDGDMAPLAHIAELCTTYAAQLIVDEAHATGVIGAHGAGVVCALGLQEQVFARVHTFGKALGCHGAAVVGSRLLQQYLINFARPFIYTTALPGHSVAAIQQAYTYLAADGFTNQPLHQLIACFRKRIQETGMQGWKDSTTPIQALLAGNNEQCKMLAAKLQKVNLNVRPILYPTVPIGMERLRVCLHMFNTPDQVDTLFEELVA